jgi:hypothetical protein
LRILKGAFCFLIILAVLWCGIFAPVGFSTPVTAATGAVALAELTEKNASAWTYSASDKAAGRIEDDYKLVKKGKASIKLTTASGFDVNLSYQLGSGKYWDLSKQKYLHFWVYSENSNIGFQENTPFIKLLSSTNGYLRYQTNSDEILNNSRGQWQECWIPLAGDAVWNRTITGSPKLTQITGIEIHTDTWDYGYQLWVDSLEFTTKSYSALTFTPTSATAGTAVKITGAYTSAITGVSFGGTAAESFVVNSRTKITAIVGAGASGKIAVTMRGGIATSTSNFVYKAPPAPKITSFKPTEGGCGTPITITGVNFTKATAVSVGGQAVSSFSVNSATKITAVVGQGSTGKVTVSGSGGKATSTAGFTFYTAPTISSFTPGTGPGGTSVSITGANFKGASEVSFGGVKASSFIVNSATKITARLGSGNSGKVTVTTPGGTATSSADFIYPGVPKVISLTPNSGSSGDSIIITGSNLWGATRVCFGTANAFSFRVDSATQITAIVGNGISGKISVTTPYGTASSTNSFSYLAVSVETPFLSQYQGQSTQNFDCGPASVAMIVQYYGKRPPASSDAAFLTQVRNSTGNTGLVDTDFDDLESALSSFGLSYSEISNSLTPAPEAQIQVIMTAIAANNPVIALIHGADLGRGEAYGDHWVVVRGFSADGKTVYLNDPDFRNPEQMKGKPAEWINGGQIGLAFDTFRDALYDTASGPYGLIVDDRASTAMTIPVLVVKYFPVSAGLIDISVTGDVDMPLEQARSLTDELTTGIIQSMENGSRYHYYKDASALPSLKYQVVGSLEYLEPLPTWNKAGISVPMTDYNQIMTRVNAQDWVMNKGVKEIWIWGYQGGKVGLWESNMASPYGDISNSNRDPDDLPVYDRTYTVYHYNYGRGVSEAIEDHMHQNEAIFNDLDHSLFWDKFVGAVGEGRCGWSHYPPNGVSDYDWQNPNYIWTDIEDWKPDGSGQKVYINSDRWNQDSLTWFIYWMQSYPGMNNPLYNGSQKLSNWWIFIGDYDNTKAGELSLEN